LIVVDDGSRRPVAELLDGVGDPRLRVLRTPHRGVSAARDAGFDASAGDFIRFVDADDVLPPDSTALLMRLNRGAADTIACGATRLCTEELEPMFDWIAACGRDPVRSCLLLRSRPMVPSMLFPRPVVEQVGPWDPAISVCEDWDFILRAFERAAVAETRRPLTWYRQHPTSSSRDQSAAWTGALRVVERYFERHPGDRRGAVGRQVRSTLEVLAAERRTSGRVWEDRRCRRVLMRNPGSVLTVYGRVIHPRVQARRMRLRRLGP
jgi:glycosyltransferase involved in cell wall biosynthesis